MVESLAQDTRSLRERAAVALAEAIRHREQDEALSVENDRTYSRGVLVRVLEDVLSVSEQEVEFEVEGRVTYALLDGFKFSGRYDHGHRQLYQHGGCPRCGEPTLATVGSLADLAQPFTPYYLHSCERPVQVPRPVPTCTRAERALLDALFEVLDERREVEP